MKHLNDKLILRSPADLRPVHQLKLNTIFRLILIVLLGSAGLSAHADLQKGQTAYDRGDYATALREWKLLAEQGDALAQTSLGLMYEYGRGVPQDDKMGAQWFTRAAEQGYARAQFNLGVMYAKGKGVPQDYVYAYMWANIAASGDSENAGKTRDVLEKKNDPVPNRRGAEISAGMCPQAI